MEILVEVGKESKCSFRCSHESDYVLKMFSETLFFCNFYQGQ